MTPLPLATVADPMQVLRLCDLVRDRACVVIGSAPLSTKYAQIDADEFTIPVNGGISSLSGMADVWVVNSKAQDASGALMRPLHKTMLDQCSNRTVNHLLFLRGPKVPSERGTLASLKVRNCRHQTWSVLDKPTKRWIEGQFCARTDDKKPCSSGILAVSAVLYCGAASVRLIGFSFKPGYHYLPKERPQSWWRDHVEADKRALVALRARFGDRLVGDVVRAVAA